eukprot:555154_1
MASEKLPTDSIPIERVNSKDIYDILEEIDGNERKIQQQEATQEIIFKHWWNNFKFGYGSHILFEIYRALNDPSLDIDYNTQTKIKDALQEAAKDNNKEYAEYNEWKLYVKTLDTQTINAFNTRYNNLMEEKQLSIEKNVIKQKSLCCFQWRLPRYRKNDIKSLIYGYHRNIIKYIPFDVIQILVNYFGNLNDKNTITKTFEQWKQFKSGQNYRSGIFEYESIKFCLKLQCNRENPWQIRLLFELITGPRDKFSECEIKGYIFFVEEAYKRFFDFRMLLEFGAMNETEIISQIEKENIDSMIKFGSATFNLYFEEVNFKDIINKNYIVTKAEEMKVMHPIITNESIIDVKYDINNNICVYEWKLSHNEINQIKNCCIVSEKRRTIMIKSQIFMVHKFQCQIWIMVEADSTESTHECDNDGMTTYGTSYFYINTFGYPLQIGGMRWWYSIVFNDKVKHCDDAAKGIGSSYHKASFKSEICLNTKELLECIRNNEDVIFKFYFNLLDVFDKNWNKISSNELSQIGCNKILNIDKLSICSLKWSVCDQLLSEIKTCKPTYGAVYFL